MMPKKFCWLSARRESFNRLISEGKSKEGVNVRAGNLLVYLEIGVKQEVQIVSKK